jgi:peptidyl-prolyl cis-trans isomerase C
MRSIRQKCVVACVLCLALAPAACNDKTLQSTAEGDAGEHATSSTLTPEQSAKVLAKVGDRTITLGDFVAVLEHMGQFDRLRYQSPERRKELLNEMINVELLAQEAIAKGYDKEPVAQEQLRSILRDAMLADLHKESPAPADIPDADVHAYYDAHRADFREPERRRVSVIVLKDEAAADDALEAAKKATTIVQWADLVRARSIETTKATTPADSVGDFGMVSPPGDMHGENTHVPEEVRAGLFEIPKLGDVLPRVVKSGGKFFVIRFSQKTEPHDRPYAEAEKSIRVKLTQDKVHQKEAEFLTQLRAKYTVSVDDAVIATVRVDTDGGAPAAMNAGDASVKDAH